MLLDRLIRTLMQTFPMPHTMWKTYVLADGELREIEEVRRYDRVGYAVIVARDEGVGITPGDERTLGRS